MTKADRLILLKKIRADRRLAVAKDLSDYQKFIFNYNDPDYAGKSATWIRKVDMKQDLDITHHAINMSDEYNEKLKEEKCKK